jgi:hypothetical protein
MYKPVYKRIHLGERFDSHMASWGRGTDLGLSLDGVAVTSRRLGLGSNLFLGISLTHVAHKASLVLIGGRLNEIAANGCHYCW